MSIPYSQRAMIAEAGSAMARLRSEIESQAAQIAALTAERDALRNALRFQVMHNVIHKGTCSYFDTANNCSCGAADEGVIGAIAASTQAHKPAIKGQTPDTREHGA